MAMRTGKKWNRLMNIERLDDRINPDATFGWEVVPPALAPAGTQPGLYFKVEGDVSGQGIDDSVSVMNNALYGTIMIAINTASADDGTPLDYFLSISGGEIALAQREYGATFKGIHVLTYDGNDTVGALGLPWAMVVEGGDGNDNLSGGNIADVIDGGAGDDTLNGSAGSDILTGGDGNDSVLGGTGNDNITTGAGSDFVNAGTGNDTVDTGTGGPTVGGVVQRLDTVLGGDGNDNITTYDGDDSINAGAGSDTVNAGDGNDSVNGGTGGPVVGGVLQANDLLIGGDGSDNIVGDDGNDTIWGDNTDGTGSGNDTIDAGSGNDTVTGGAGNDGVDAGTGNDSVDGGTGNDNLVGNTGDDTVTGGTGNDTVNGGAGADSLTAGAGNDSVVAGTDDVYLNGGTGTDTVSVAVESQPTLSPNVVLSPQQTDVASPPLVPGTFLNGADFESFNVAAAANVTFAPATADYTAISPPNYSGVVLNAGDTLDFRYAPTGQTIDMNNLPFGLAGAGITSVNGSIYGDNITGTSGNDSIFGAGGNDVIQGLDGNDTLQGGTGDDILLGGNGDDNLVIEWNGGVLNANDIALGQNGYDTWTFQGTTAASLGTILPYMSQQNASAKFDWNLGNAGPDNPTIQFRP